MIELGHETDRKPPFRYAAYTRVGFSETDAQGVVTRRIQSPGEVQGTSERAIVRET